jgi:hypothetical protein
MCVYAVCVNDPHEKSSDAIHGVLLDALVNFVSDPQGCSCVI